MNITHKRECGDCTKCCEGSLVLTVQGNAINKSNPCHFVSMGKCNGCTIYEQRPQVCKDFECEWILDSSIPEWLKPSVSGIIMIKQEPNNDMTYYEVVETDTKIDSVILNWLLLFALKNKHNIKYQVNREVNMFGSAKFLEYMNKKTR